MTVFILIDREGSELWKEQLLMINTTINDWTKSHNTRISNTISVMYNCGRWWCLANDKTPTDPVTNFEQQESSPFEWLLNRYNCN